MNKYKLIYTATCFGALWFFISLFSEHPVFSLLSAEAEIRWTGGLLQLAGFSLLAWKLNNAGEKHNSVTISKHINLFFAKIINKFRPAPKQTIIGTTFVSETGSDNFFGRGRIIQSISHLSTTEQISALEAQLRSVEKEMDAIRDSQVKLKADFSELLSKEKATIQEQIAVLHAGIRQIEVGDIHLDWFALLLFFFGVILATVSSEICTWFFLSQFCN